MRGDTWFGGGDKHKDRWNRPGCDTIIQVLYKYFASKNAFRVINKMWWRSYSRFYNGIKDSIIGLYTGGPENVSPLPFQPSVEYPVNVYVQITWTLSYTVHTPSWAVCIYSALSIRYQVDSWIVHDSIYARHDLHWIHKTCSLNLFSASKRNI